MNLAGINYVFRLKISIFFSHKYNIRNGVIKRLMTKFLT
jgi:hypothetical protein